MKSAEIVQAIIDAKQINPDTDEINEAVELVEYESNDFTLDLDGEEYRLIHTNDIDEIQQGELSSDLYCLGCFNANFLASVLDMDQDVIDAMQEAEAYEAVGKLIMSLNKLEELQTEYASADGYGHHFSGYDGSEEEIGDYYVFRTN